MFGSIPSLLGIHRNWGFVWKPSKNMFGKIFFLSEFGIYFQLSSHFFVNSWEKKTRSDWTFFSQTLWCSLMVYVKLSSKESTLSQFRMIIVLCRISFLIDINMLIFLAFFYFMKYLNYNFISWNFMLISVWLNLFYNNY